MLSQVRLHVFLAPFRSFREARISTTVGRSGEGLRKNKRFLPSTSILRMAKLYIGQDAILRTTTLDLLQLGTLTPDPGHAGLVGRRRDGRTNRSG